jgi:hypothetical protein
MIPYIRNRNCQCVRCRAHGLMAPAVLITFGVLFLLDNYHVIRFNQSVPVVFLVIGCVLLISRTGSTEGHVQPGWSQGPVMQPPGSETWPAANTTQPPQAQQTISGTGNPSSGQDDSEVKP